MEETKVEKKFENLPSKELKDLYLKIKEFTDFLNKESEKIKKNEVR